MQKVCKLFVHPWTSPGRLQGVAIISPRNSDRLQSHSRPVVHVVCPDCSSITRYSEMADATLDRVDGIEVDTGQVPQTGAFAPQVHFSTNAIYLPRVFIRFDWSLCPASCFATYASVGSMRATCLLLLCTLGLCAQASKFGGDPDAHPPVSEADVRIVQEARKILNSPAQWNRSDNRECPATQKTYSIYCALEKATEEVSKNFQHRGAAMQEARFVIDEVLATGNHYEHRLKDYNNDPKTTFSDVRKFFDLLEARIKSRLAAQSKP